MHPVKWLKLKTKPKKLTIQSIGKYTEKHRRTKKKKKKKRQNGTKANKFSNSVTILFWKGHVGT